MLVTSILKKPFENIVGKEENAGNQHLFFSHNVFYAMKNFVFW